MRRGKKRRTEWNCADPKAFATDTLDMLIRRWPNTFVEAMHVIAEAVENSNG